MTLPWPTSVFEAFGTSHLVMLAVFVVGIWPVVAAGTSPSWPPPARCRVSRDLRRADPVRHDPAAGDRLPARAATSLQTTLPIQLCDLAWIAATVALWTRLPNRGALTYFWGLGLTTQGLLTPSLARDFETRSSLGTLCRGMHILGGVGRDLPDLGARGGGGGGGWTIALTAAWAVTVFIHQQHPSAPIHLASPQDNNPRSTEMATIHHTSRSP